MTNSAIRITVRIKGTPMRAVLNTGANVSIVILSVVKKLHLTMGMPDGSKIIAVDQTKNNVISIVRDALLSIQDARVPVNLLVIEASEDNLLLRTNWMDWYQADLSFHRKELKFWCRGQDFITLSKRIELVLQVQTIARNSMKLTCSSWSRNRSTNNITKTINWVK